MAVATDVETETIEHLDFDPKCSLRTVEAEKINKAWTIRGLSRPCEAPAVASMRCRACGEFGYVCAGHRSAIIAMVAVSCGRCDATAPALALFEFTPLGGA
jgi:hypothetical protein